MHVNIKLFADGADYDSIAALAGAPHIKGFTTNPTLMRKAGVVDYRKFAREVLAVVPDKPISFEVLSDDFDEMHEQALEIASWGANVYVKIPVTNTKREPALPLIETLARQGVKVNVTAVMTPDQVAMIVDHLDPAVPSCVSVFAGRIADTGRDPLPLMKASLAHLSALPRAELVWASPREVLNVCQADALGCHIITVTTDLLRKLPALGKNLDDFSLETVQMFRADAVAAGFCI
jgi:transaldolase